MSKKTDPANFFGGGNNALQSKIGDPVNLLGSGNNIVQSAGSDVQNGINGVETGLNHIGNLFNKAVGTLSGGKLGGANSNLLQHIGPNKPPAPVVTPPVVMPLPDDQAVAAAKKRQMALLGAGSGRASTVLSQGNDTLGG